MRFATNKRKKGFTLVEVVLVLAIAGLIMVMVLIALPALQRGQRNTQRRRDLSLIVAQMDKWRIHNSNISVTDNGNKTQAFSKKNGFCTFYKKYVPADMKDPSTGEPYKAALWNVKVAYNCITGQTFQRNGYDETAVGRSPNSKWAKMEVGDIQYDDVAMCDGEVFNDKMGKSAGVHAFAMRIYLEGGSTLCLDNGMIRKEQSFENTAPANPINAFGIIGN